VTASGEGWATAAGPVQLTVAGLGEVPAPVLRRLTASDWVRTRGWLRPLSANCSPGGATAAQTVATIERHAISGGSPGHASREPSRPQWTAPSES
jgi:hypothetical protein